MSNDQPDPGNRGKKKPPSGGFSYLMGTVSDGEGFHSLVQSALVTRSFVLGHNTLVNHTVDYWNSILVGRCCSIFVAGITSLNDVLDFGAHKRTLAHIVLTGLFRCAGAFSC